MNLTGLLILLSFIPGFPSSQAPENFEMSKPLSERLVGVNKVLCMRNGNTLLFHIEPVEGIFVTVFDSNRTEISGQRVPCQLLDVFRLHKAQFKGLFEINNEAVLFFDQEDRANKHILIRLQYNSTTGWLTKEEVVARSASNNKRANFYILKNRAEKGYALLISKVRNYPKTADISVDYYNENHHLLRRIPLAVDRKKYDYVEVMGAENLVSGTMVTLAFSKIKEGGGMSHGKVYDSLNNFFDVPDRVPNDNAGKPQLGDAYAASYDELDPVNTIFDHYLGMYFLPRDSSRPVCRIANVSTAIYPFHVYCADNSFADRVNLLLVSYKDAYRKFGLQILPDEVMANELITLDKNDQSVTFESIRNQKANKALVNARDTGHYFYGFPISFETNPNGLSTLISESFERNAAIESQDRPRLFETYLGAICITQFDDEGKEIWGAVLPKAQYFKSYQHYYYAHFAGAKWHDHPLFGDYPDQVQDRQLVSVKSCSRGRDWYVFFNDADANAGILHGQSADTVYEPSRSNTWCYRINAGKEIMKKKVFTLPGKEVSCASFLEGSDYDEARGTLASLVLTTVDQKTTFRMAWVRL